MTTNPRTYSLKELEILFDPSSNKIECIKMLRAITREGLKETKDFYEHVIQPAIDHGTKVRPANPITSKEDDDDQSDPIRTPTPPMYLIGQTYRQLNKQVVLIIGAANQNTDWETVYSIDEKGYLIHRYNRRDFGRVTGCDINDPRNLEILR